MVVRDQVCATDAAELIEFSWLNATADIVIAVAFLALSAMLFQLARRRRDLAFKSVFLLFALFLLATSAAHWVVAFTPYLPYLQSAFWPKALAALLAVIAAIALYKQLPHALAMPSRMALSDLNTKLQMENEQQRRTESTLKQAYAELEKNVAHRTAELSEANARLQQEIIEHWRAEQALRQSQARFSGILDSAMDAIITVDDEECVLLFNMAAERVFRCERSTAIGKPLSRFIPRSEANPEHIRVFAHEGNSSETAPQSVMLAGRRSDGLQLQLEASVAQLSEQGKRYYTVIVRDVTERLRVEQALQHSELMLRKLNEELEKHVFERTAALTATIRELESFSYSVSHDLRAPLRAVDGFAQILLQEHAAELNIEGRRLLDKISHNARKMAQLIDGLLQFSRLGRAEASYARVNMTHLAQTVAQEVKTQESNSSLQIEIGGLPTIHGDAAMLRQVWVNLLTNAAKFSAKRSKPEIQVCGNEYAGEAIYMVRDNGAGFDAAYAEKLFGVFQRLHRADEFPGVGVGLAIVKRVIERHGGRVWAEGAPDAGAAFYFSIRLPESAQIDN